MKTSKEYIKMCEKAVEIQKEWKTKAFDIYQDKSEIIRGVGEDYGCEFAGEGISEYGWEKEVLWLPRQDQLQEIWLKEFNNLFAEDMIDYFYDWFRALPIKRPRKSMEQLWLAFVMSEKYEKTWNGKEWIKKGH